MLCIACATRVAAVGGSRSCNFSAHGRRCPMRWDKDNVRNGMFVMGTQGERIGKVIRCDEDTFVVEKGVFFPNDDEFRSAHITDERAGPVRYALTDFLRGRDLESVTTPKPAPAAREAA